jgi:hypothetical protein
MTREGVVQSIFGKTEVFLPRKNDATIGCCAAHFVVENRIKEYELFELNDLNGQLFSFSGSSHDYPAAWVTCGEQLPYSLLKTIERVDGNFGQMMNA